MPVYARGTVPLFQVFLGFLLTLTHPYDLGLTTDGVGFSGVLAGRRSRQIIRFRNEPDDARYRWRFHE